MGINYAKIIGDIILMSMVEMNMGICIYIYISIYISIYVCIQIGKLLYVDMGNLFSTFLSYRHGTCGNWEMLESIYCKYTSLGYVSWSLGFLG